jgi:hypothetical protein
MNWKKFLKPDWKKIVILIIIFLIIPIPDLFFMYAPRGPQTCYEWYPNGTEVNTSCPADVYRGNEIPSLNLIGLIIDLIISPTNNSNSSSIEEEPLITIIFLIISYIISCLIVWIYDKNFKKVKKKK